MVLEASVPLNFWVIWMVFWVRWMEKFHSSKWQITNFESKEKLLALTHEPDL